MDNPFTDKLPLGWVAVLVIGEDVNVYPVYSIINQSNIIIADCQIDNLMPLKTHIAYAWYRYRLDAS